MTNAVHVMGGPQVDLDGDSRLCTDPDQGETKVYHVDCVPVDYNGRREWTCAGCGETTQTYATLN